MGCIRVGVYGKGNLCFKLTVDSRGTSLPFPPLVTPFLPSFFLPLFVLIAHRKDPVISKTDNFPVITYDYFPSAPFAITTKIPTSLASANPEWVGA